MFYSLSTLFFPRYVLFLTHSDNVFVTGSSPRLAFFTRDEDAKETVKGLKALKQSDKTALSSLTAVLRLPMVDGEATGLRQNIVDFLDKKKVQRH